MNDALTAEIRRALAELVDAAPLPPDLPLSPVPAVGRRARARLPVAVAVLAVVASVGLVAVQRDGREPGETTVAVRPPLADPAGPTPIGPFTLPAATFVMPTDLPAGLRFVEGGTRATSGGGQEVVVLVGPDGGVARLGWNPGSCNLPSPVTTTRDGRSGGPGTILAPTPGEAPWSAEGATGALRWCADGNMFITLNTEGLGEAAARALALSVVRLAGDPTELTLTPPPGFVAARASATGPYSALAYTSASGGRLAIQIRGAWTTDLRLLEANAMFGSTSRVNPAGHPGFLTGMPAGAQTHYLTLVYDNQTLVTMSASGLTANQLLAVAASLRPADPSLAPDVAGDPARCARLGMCG